jgi:hypothetical protein
MPCEIQLSGAVALYFYDELPPADRAVLQEHLSICPECRRALQDLSAIRAALASRPDVATPPGGDWSAFMARLDDGVSRLRRRDPVAGGHGPRAHRTYVPYLAMAAMLALVTVSVLFVARARHDAGTMRSAAGPNPAAAAVRPGPAGIGTAPSTAATDENAAFAALSEQHFERSKLVVLGLATKDPNATSEGDWTYERQLASSLLSDTRLYRLVAEQRGMTSLARVMGDLELVLLQTSMSERSDPAALEQLQRLIAKRDLVTKMEFVTTGL